MPMPSQGTLSSRFLHGEEDEAEAEQDGRAGGRQDLADELDARREGQEDRRQQGGQEDGQIKHVGCHLSHQLMLDVAMLTSFMG